MAHRPQGNTFASYHIIRGRIKDTETLLCQQRSNLVRAVIFPVVMYACESWTIKKAAAAAAKSLQSCPTLCNPVDGSPSGSPISGILQARTLEWVAISFSNACKWKVKVKSLSRVRLLATHGLQPTRLLRPWDFPGKSTGVGCHCLLRKKAECRRIDGL